MKRKRLTGGKPARQSGAILLIAMIFLLLLAIIAGTVSQTSILEFLMAGNAQFREEAFQQSQALVDEITADINNFPVIGDVGYKVCKIGDSGCNAYTLDPESATSNAEFSVVRRGPLILESLPFRQGESSASSSPNFDAAIFEVNVAVDGSAQRLGSAQIVQGVAVRIASSGQ
ncbi:MAG: hypothetical protein V7742_18010 [Halioglobus sp.]